MADAPQTAGLPYIMLLMVPVGEWISGFHGQQISSPELGNAIRAIDQVVQRINAFKVEPQFTEEVKSRRERIPDFNLTDEEILRTFITLIAFSNQARSDRVKRLVDGGIFAQIFQNYSIEKTARLSAESVIRDCWAQVKDIRFKYKVDRMIGCARCLLTLRERHPSFMTYIKGVGQFGILKSESDIGLFWRGFRQTQDYLLELHFPYFVNFTSLCHLLKELGFDCAKPDSAVMSAAVSLGIVPPAPKQKKNPAKSRAHPEKSLQKAVETIQRYGVHRGIRVPVLDLYFLIHGQQADATRFVQPAYYS